MLLDTACNTLDPVILITELQ